MKIEEAIYSRLAMAIPAKAAKPTISKPADPGSGVFVPLPEGSPARTSVKSTLSAGAEAEMEMY